MCKSTENFSFIIVIQDYWGIFFRLYFMCISPVILWRFIKVLYTLVTNVKLPCKRFWIAWICVMIFLMDYNVWSWCRNIMDYNVWNSCLAVILCQYKIYVVEEDVSYWKFLKLCLLFLIIFSPHFIHQEEELLRTFNKQLEEDRRIVISRSNLNELHKV